VTARYKEGLRQELLAALRSERDVLRSAQRATQQGVTHEENRAEGDKDMRSTEASYLARGQAERVVALERDVLLVELMLLRSFTADDVVAVSALVKLAADDGRQSVLFLAPAGGGTRLDAGAVRVVTPGSPLGQALIGAAQGDEVLVAQAEREQSYEIVELS
jgi:transcription elongation GreA/GreB family factor